LSGTTELAFVREVHLGETLLPFRTLSPLEAVLPITDDGILSQDQIEAHADLSEWWSMVEHAWESTKVEGDISPFLRRIDYHGQLSAQLPAAQHRVVYSKSGNTLAAARVESPGVVIENRLYWAGVSSVDEGRYLVGILNSASLLVRVRPFQAVGLFGPRDFDKNVFMAPIRPYDPEDEDHRQLVARVATAERVSAEVDLGDAPPHFQAARRLVRDRLQACGITADIDEVVRRVIP
jgi:hypothetical protein